MTKITPCLWFNTQAEEATNFYVSIFPNAKINNITHYTEAGKEIHQMQPGSILTVDFELDGNPFTALNGGPAFTFSEAISFQVYCDTQDQIDNYWNKLSAVPESEQCGWLKDKFGVSWQIVPTIMDKLLADDDPARAERVMQTFMPMKKIVIADLEKAARG